MLSLLIPALVAIAIACNPPLNDFKYLGNETHTTLDMIQGLINQAGMGWTEIVTQVGHLSHHNRSHGC
jgi:hypothetical protein